MRHGSAPGLAAGKPAPFGNGVGLQSTEKVRAGLERLRVLDPSAASAGADEYAEFLWHEATHQVLFLAELLQPALHRGAQQRADAAGHERDPPHPAQL
ncbi:MAG TPA: hypothetical protein VFS67_05615 [Polyangiaceae bacterium]|nr:hypothetical protein [Polyangiaceae bacterium]